MMWGRSKDSGIWICSTSDWRVMLSGHDALYIAAFKLRLRLMKFWRMSA
jgi:hypothetical protein